MRRIIAGVVSAVVVVVVGAFAVYHVTSVPEPLSISYREASVDGDLHYLLLRQLGYTMIAPLGVSFMSDEGELTIVATERQTDGSFYWHVLGSIPVTGNRGRPFDTVVYLCYKSITRDDRGEEFEIMVVSKDTETAAMKKTFRTPAHTYVMHYGARLPRYNMGALQEVLQVNASGFPGRRLSVGIAVSATPADRVESPVGSVRFGSVIYIEPCGMGSCK